MDRSVGAMQGPDSSLEVNVRGFSAGSYSGLAFLHILWSIPKVTTKGCLGAIACPPSLLNMSRAKEEDQLHLIHFESDRLCSWKPGPKQMQDCCTSFTYITNEIASYKGHFGPDEHDYSHWMALNLPKGNIALRVLLFIRPEAASKAKRDATPLRLISWLSYKLNPELELFIEQAMEHLSTWKETEGGKVLTMGKDAIQQGETINTEVELRDRLIDLVSVGNLKHKPEALFTLFRQFLTRISLPRLIHFLDLVLPQLMPVQAAWAGEEKTLWSCHYIRWLREKQSAATPRVQISYFFSSHDNVHHVRIQWNSNPLLLFSDPQMVEALPVDFRQQASHMTHQQHLQMGLRKGMAILIYYVVGRTHYQAPSPATRSRYAHLPHHDTPDAPPKLLPAASIPYYHMGMDQLCQPAVLHDKELVPSLWLAAFAALIGTTLTNEHNALLQHPLIPPQFPSKLPRFKRGTSTKLRTTSLKSSPAPVPRGPSKTDVPAVRVHSLPLTMHPFKSSLVPLWIISLPGLTIFLLGSPS